MEIKYAEKADKPNDLIIRELLSNILQILLKSNGATQEQIIRLITRVLWR